MKKILVWSSGSKGSLDDDYTLYEDGEVLHEYDRHIYPGGQNLTEYLKANELSFEVKERLLKASSDEHRETVKNLLDSVVF